MKCFASPLDVCHNILRCTSLGAGKCAYEKELLNIPIETSTKMSLDTIIFFKDGKEVGRIEGIKMNKMKFQFFTIMQEEAVLFATVEMNSAKDYIVFEDDFGRKWKLTPVTNENIKSPFIVNPIYEKKE